MKYLNIKLKTCEMVKHVWKVKVFMHVLPFGFYFAGRKKKPAKIKQHHWSLNLVVCLRNAISKLRSLFSKIAITVTMTARIHVQTASNSDKIDVVETYVLVHCTHTYMQCLKLWIVYPFVNAIQTRIQVGKKCNWKHKVSDRTWSLAIYLIHLILWLVVHILLC